MHSSRPSRQVSTLVGGILIVLLGVLAILALPQDKPFVDSAERRNYSDGLDASKGKFDPAAVVISDGRIHLPANFNRDCAYHCAAAKPDGRGGYKVSLPVAFVLDNNAEPNHGELLTVSELTFWNPIEHRRQTIDTAKRKASTLPDFLLRTLDAASLKEGTTGYTSAWLPHFTTDGKACLWSDNIRHEPLGSYYGYTDDEAKVTKRDGVLVVEMPKGFEPVTHLWTPKDCTPVTLG